MILFARCPPPDPHSRSYVAHAVSRARAPSAPRHMRGVFHVPRFVLDPTSSERGTTMKLTGAQALIKSLEMEGVEVMFGLPGGAILPVYDPLIDSSIRHILVRHEQGAGHMASGYAHATGRPGVAMVTSGPAATNIVTPLCDAYMDSIPIVVHHRAGAVQGDRHRRVPGVRHGRHHDAGHQAQLADHRRAATSRASSARRSTSRRRAGPVRCSSTSRRTSRTRRWSGTGRRRSTCPATSRP